MKINEQRFPRKKKRKKKKITRRMFVFYYRNVIIIVRRTNEKMLNNMKIIETMTYSFSFFISFGNAKKKKKSLKCSKTKALL